MKKVSVILTTYNSEEQLQDVLDSIYSQQGINELFEIELLVVDDCSIDSTPQILSSNRIDFESTLSNTGGPNYGRNLALKKCTGDYICIADHDDVWYPNKIRRLLSVIHLAPIVTSGYTLVDLSKSEKIIRVSKSSNSDGYSQYLRNQTFLSKLLKDQNGQQTYLGSILYDASLKDILFEEKHGMVDFDWILKLFHQRESVEICESLYLRTVRSDNLSLNEEYRINDYNFSLSTILQYQKSFPNEVVIAGKKINGSMARYYYLIGNMQLARRYFLKSSIDVKTMLYLITTFVGSNIVKRFFKVFG